MPGELSLEALLAPYPIDDFLRKVWGKEFLYVPGEQAKFASLFSWNALNRAIEQHRLEPPRLRLEKAGTPREDLDFINYRPARRGGSIPRIDVPRFYAHLKEGATLVFDAIDEVSEPIARTCDSLSARFLTHVQVNLYGSWGNSRGFGLHWDDHDVFILQLSGSKHWKVYGPTRSHPLYRDTAPNVEKPTEPTWERSITAGDFLYIPRGHWHDVVGNDEPTLHLTFGINNATGIDLLYWLADNYRGIDLLRRDLPLFEDAHEKQRYTESFTSTIHDMLSEDLLRRYFESRASQLGSRPHLSLPYAPYSSVSLDPNLTFRCSGSTYSGLETNDGVVTVQAHGREWKFSADASSIIELLLTQRSLTLAELSAVAPHLAQESVATLVDHLIGEGFVHIERVAG